ncbi:MAG: OsmC family peroxiredoxin [Arenibacter sp.]|nr:OsmC family peroxiredoxin [Arenibacter sp.]
MKRTAHALWSGSIKEGEGKLTTQSKVLNNTQYSFTSRFGHETSTNPEELLAAAHGGCFVMALCKILGEAGYTPNYLDVAATVILDVDKLEITESHLYLKAKVPNIALKKFKEYALLAKDHCPMSKALSLNIILDAVLE